MARPEGTYKYTPEEVSDLIKRYFDTITLEVPRTKKPEKDPDKVFDDDFEEPVLNRAGEPIIDTHFTEIPSILGMCEFMDIHRSTLLEYESNPSYSNTIKKAKQKIEKYNADQLFRQQQVTGIIFNLKNNFDWKDKQEIDQKTDGTIKFVIE